MNKFTTYAEDTLNDYAYRARRAEEQATAEWLAHYGCERGSVCNGLGIIGFGVLRGDLSTERLVAELGDAAYDYALDRGVAYACTYGGVACAGAMGVKGLITGELTEHEAGEVIGSVAGTAIGCSIGPIGCVVGGVVGGAIGGVVGDSGVIGAVGGVAGSIVTGGAGVVAGGVKAVGDAVKGVVGAIF